MKYIRENKNNTYTIIKNNKTYGTFDNLISAKTVRNKLIKDNFGEKNKYKYIYSRKNKYIIERKGEYYGIFKTLEEAIIERDKWEKCGWDLDVIIELP